MRASTTGWLAILFWSLASSAYAAPACDSEKILRNNIDAYQGNFVVWLSYVNNLTRNMAQGQSDSIGVTYEDIPMTFNEAKSLSEFFGQQTSYNLSEQQSVSVLRSTLSADSVKAYVACIKANRGLAIALPDAALNEESFQFTVDWNPDYTPTGKVLEFKVTNGKLDGPSRVTIGNHPWHKSFSLKRDLSKTLFVSATIDSQTDLVSLPAKPKFVMKLREKYSDSFKYIRDAFHGVAPIKEDYCIPADADAVLLPSTMVPEVKIIGTHPRATVNEDKTNNIHRACGRIYDDTPCKECTQQISGRFSIYEAYFEASPTAILGKTEFVKKRSFADFAPATK